MPVIRISPQVEQLLRSKGRFGDTHDSVLRKILGLPPKHGFPGGGNRDKGKKGKQPQAGEQVQAAGRGKQNQAQRANPAPSGGPNRPNQPQKKGGAAPSGHQQAKPSQKVNPGKSQQNRQAGKAPDAGMKNKKGEQKKAASPVVYRHMLLDVLLKAPGHKLHVGGLWPKIKKRVKAQSSKGQKKQAGKKPQWRKKIAQAKKGLVKSGLVRRMKQGSTAEWMLTPRGVKWAKQLRTKKASK
jgi:high-affinity Fe2+/Pb2+ permease